MNNDEVTQLRDMLEHIKKSERTKRDEICRLNGVVRELNTTNILLSLATLVFMATFVVRIITE